MERKELQKKLIELEEQLRLICPDIYSFIWDYQEGQSEHFDKLNKSERIAIIDIFSKVKSLYEALGTYHSWFWKGGKQ